MMNPQLALSLKVFQICLEAQSVVALRLLRLVLAALAPGRQT
jgi:hypothetical protein